MLDRLVAEVWLARGLKYSLSRWVSDRRHPGAWDLPFSATLVKAGISLNGMTDLRGIVDALGKHVHYRWDPLHGAVDHVTPPATTLANGFGDCDDVAALNAAAVAYALGQGGWRSRIVSYLASDFRLSHHVCAAIAPGGRIFAIQPYPEPGKTGDPLVAQAFKSFAHLANEVASWYGVRVVGFDVRAANWTVIEKWRWLT